MYLIREDINRKVWFSFGTLPKLSKSPPDPDFGNLILFFGRLYSRLERPKEKEIFLLMSSLMEDASVIEIVQSLNQKLFYFGKSLAELQKF